MLKGIDPLLTPDLLKRLAEMGHGDEILIADANFAALPLAGGKPVMYLPGAGVQRTCQAVLSLIPLDDDVGQPVTYMHVCDMPADYRSGLQRQVISSITSAGWATHQQFRAMERFNFYDKVKSAATIVVTGELQPYANFLLKKGVIGEPLAS